MCDEFNDSDDLEVSLRTTVVADCKGTSPRFVLALTGQAAARSGKERHYHIRIESARAISLRGRCLHPNRFELLERCADFKSKLPTRYDCAIVTIGVFRSGPSCLVALARLEYGWLCTLTSDVNRKRKQAHSQLLGVFIAICLPTTGQRRRLQCIGKYLVVGRR
jgi:hypothetical protein